MKNKKNIVGSENHVSIQRQKDLSNSSLNVLSANDSFENCAENRLLELLCNICTIFIGPITKLDEDCILILINFCMTSYILCIFAHTNAIHNECYMYIYGSFVISQQEFIRSYVSIVK